MKLGILSVFVVGVLGTFGCQRDKGASGPERSALGTERGDCRPDKTCDPGLLCLSNLCVRPPPADCQLVADQIASMELGNYAPVEDRAPTVAKYKAACEKAYVSKEQGECLDKARDKWSAAQCAPGMFPELEASGKAGDCVAVANKIRGAMGRQMGNAPDPQTQQMFAKVMAVIQQSCEQDGWPDVLKKCISLSADSDDAMQSCNQQMPPGLQQKISERMSKAMQNQ
jgi:hypothetical protein